MSPKNTKENLLALALTYSSAEEFKAKNLPKYLLAIRHRVLHKAFPKVEPPPKPPKGIFKLYNGPTIVYVSHSTTDLLKAIEACKTTNMKYDSYIYFILTNDSDIYTLSHYLAYSHRAKYNNNLSNQKLSYTIMGLKVTLGKPTKGKR